MRGSGERFAEEIGLRGSETEDMMVQEKTRYENDVCERQQDSMSANRAIMHSDVIDASINTHTP